MNVQQKDRDDFMQLINLDDINILKVGNEILMCGTIYEDNGAYYFCFFPDIAVDSKKTIKRLAMNLDDWNKFLLQSDIMETEILAKAKDGKIVKAIIRKTTRRIENRVSWRVFQRDKYKCRYCGKTGIPLTVDHLVLWEEGGPSIPKNLVTSCRQCNNKRGSTPYRDWLKDEYYLKVSQNLPEEIRKLNKKILLGLHRVPIKHHIISR